MGKSVEMCINFHIRILCCSFQNSPIPWDIANSAKPLHSRAVNPTNAVPFVATRCLSASSVTLAVMREAGMWQYDWPSMLKDGQTSPAAMWSGWCPFTLSTLQAISTAPSCGKASTCNPGRPPGEDSLIAEAMLRPTEMSSVSMVTLQFMTYGLAPTPAWHKWGQNTNCLMSLVFKCLFSISGSELLAIRRFLKSDHYTMRNTQQNEQR